MWSQQGGVDPRLAACDSRDSDPDALQVWLKNLKCVRQAVFRATPLFKHEYGGRVVRKSGAASRTRPYTSFTLRRLYFVVLRFVDTLCRLFDRLSVFD